MQIALGRLREAVRRSLLERARDVEYRAIAKRVYDSLLAKVRGKTVRDLGMQIDMFEDTMFVHAPFADFNVELPASLGDLEFGIQIGNDVTTAADGVSIEPGRLAFTPRGMVVIGFNGYETGPEGALKDDPTQSRGTRRARSKLRTREYGEHNAEDIDVGWILELRRAVFIHELVHQLDQHHRPDADSLRTQFKKDLESGVYWDSEPELNAYFVQAFEDMVISLEDEVGGTPTQVDAKRFAPTAEALWQQFDSHFYQPMRRIHGIKFKRGPQYDADGKPLGKFQLTPDKLRKRYVARLVDAWYEYVSSLPAR